MTIDLKSEKNAKMGKAGEGGKSLWERRRRGLLNLTDRVENTPFNPFTLRVSLESVVCYSHTLDIIFWLKQIFTKYLKESSCLTCDQHFSFKCFQENVLVS